MTKKRIVFGIFTVVYAIALLVLQRFNAIILVETHSADYIYTADGFLHALKLIGVETIVAAILFEIAERVYFGLEDDGED